MYVCVWVGLGLWWWGGGGGGGGGSSVGIATELRAGRPGSNHGGDENFRRPDRPLGPPSLL